MATMNSREPTPGLTRIAVIGGSGLESLLQGARQVRIGTVYGPAPLISVGTIGKEEVAFLPRHGPKHDLPPHRVNYRANLSALKQLGVERIIATNAVGSINSEYNPGDLSIPVDIIDMTKSRTTTFFDSSPVTHIDVSQPYCPEMRRAMINSSKDGKVKVWDDSVLVATEGPRYETPAEIRMLEKLGGDLVGMTGAPETFLARELEICYSTVCFISNRAAGKQAKLSAVEVMEIGKRTLPEITNLIRKTVERIPAKRTCVCSGATEQAQV
jgi:5'-methylthioadenosine phosphorylase